MIRITAGKTGPWRITRVIPVAGETLPAADRLATGPDIAPGPGASWSLRGVASNQRYTERTEDDALRAAQDPLGRPAARRAALIPIRKTASWWQMAQDERRQVFEAASQHIGIGMEYLPAIARRLLHARDLGEPFDFLTWFEFAPEHEPAFEDMLRRLRATREWTFVDREVDIRLERAD